MGACLARELAARRWRRDGRKARASEVLKSQTSWKLRGGEKAPRNEEEDVDAAQNSWKIASTDDGDAWRNAEASDTFARNVCGNAPTTSISPPSRVGDDVIFSIRRETCSLARVSTRGWSRFGAVCEFGSRGGGCFLRGGQISRGFRARRGHCVRVLRVTER